MVSQSRAVRIIIYSQYRWKVTTIHLVHNIWKYVYRTQCLVPVVEEAFGGKSPSYSTILKLDRKIRDFEIPSSLQLGIPGDANQTNMSLSLSMQRYMLFCEKETSEE